MGFFYILHVIVCIVLICVILFQDGKTGGLVSVADTGSNMFGGKGASGFLTKLTSVIAVAFMFSSIFLAFQSSPSNKSIASDHVPTNAAPGDPTASPTGQDGAAQPAGDLMDGRNLGDALEGIDVIQDPNSDELPPEFRQNNQPQPKPAADGNKPDGENGAENGQEPPSSEDGEDANNQ